MGDHAITGVFASTEPTVAEKIFARPKEGHGVIHFLRT